MAKKKATKATKKGKTAKAPAKKLKRSKAVKKSPKAAAKKKASKAAGTKKTAGRPKKAARKATRQTGVKILLHKKSGEWVELVGVKQIAAKAPDSYRAPWTVVDSRNVDHPAWPDVDRRVELGTGESE
jgi:hypothetical protein